MPGVSVARVVCEEADVGADFTAAVNAMLASPAECPDMAGANERAELKRIWEMTAEARSGRVTD